MTIVWMAATTRRRRATVLLGVAACLLSAGCHKRVVVPTLPPVLKTPDLQPPPSVSPSMEAPPPDSITHAPTVRVVEKKPVHRARKSPKTAAGIAPPPATEMATTTPPPTPVAAVLGELTTGGEVSPKTQQDTMELIAADERRLQAVAGTKARDQAAQLKEVRHFLDQAREVLATGDAEGAKTLATKAKLLIDDLEKWAAK